MFYQALKHLFLIVHCTGYGGGMGGGMSAYGGGYGGGGYGGGYGGMGGYGGRAVICKSALSAFCFCCVSQIY